MTEVRQRVVVTDASVLINFAWIERFDVFGALEHYDFWVPAGVAGEVLHSSQARALEAAFDQGYLRRMDLSPEELKAARGVQKAFRLGRGESLCLVLARSQSGWIACDEEVSRFKRAVVEVLGPGRLLNTSGIVVLALRQGSLTLAEADAFIEVWNRNRYRVGFRSFVELIELESGGGAVGEACFASVRYWKETPGSVTDG